jgi:hypothetical protein
MAKAIVLGYRDVDEGATASDLILRATVVFVGAGVPNSPIMGEGAEGNGVPIAINITALNQYANNVEDACLAEALRLGVTGLNRSDILMPTYSRGS